MRVAAILSSALLLFLAADATAQNDSDSGYARTGFYLGMTGLFAAEDFSSRFQSTRVDPNNGWGFSTRGGWRFAERGAVELMVEWAHFGVSPVGGGRSLDFDSVATTVNLKWIFPLGRVEPFALFGMGPHVQVAHSAGRTAVAYAWRGGAGLNLHLTENLSALMEGSYLGTTGRNDDIPYGSLGLGLQLRF